MGEIDVSLVQRNKRQAHQLKVIDHRCYGYRTIKSCLEYLKIPVIKAPLLISRLVIGPSTKKQKTHPIISHRPPPLSPEYKPPYTGRQLY